MIPVRVSFWYEFIPVLTYRSVFVYMIPVKNLIPVQLVPVRDFTCKHPLRLIVRVINFLNVFAKRGQSNLVLEFNNYTTRIAKSNMCVLQILWNCCSRLIIHKLESFCADFMSIMASI